MKSQEINIDIKSPRQSNTNEIKNSEYISSLSDILDHSDPEVVRNDESSVLLMGPTGVGKTTLINYLSGANLECKEYKDKYGSPEAVVDVKDSRTDLIIGHTPKSQTKIPNKLYDKVKKTTYWDCPGFEDTKGQDIANAFYIKKLFDIPKSIN